MTSSYFFTLAIGLLAQLFFSGRILIQWFMSEKAKEVKSPTLFWVLSLIGSLLLCTYGLLRDDLSIILGQCISYYIYIWNLKAKGITQQMGKPVVGLLLVLPVSFAVWLLCDSQKFLETFLFNEDIPLPLVLFGIAGQCTFTFRFIYQWLYCRRIKESILPAGFWWISLIGSSMIILYGTIRLDAVLILGQSIGFVAYIRNLTLWHKTKALHRKGKRVGSTD